MGVDPTAPLEHAASVKSIEASQTAVDTSANSPSLKPVIAKADDSPAIIPEVKRAEDPAPGGADAAACDAIYYLLLVKVLHADAIPA
jgi:hypothetical protein